MKRIILTICIALLATGCVKKEAYVNFIKESLQAEDHVSASLYSVEKVGMDFPAAGGSASVSILATSSWTVSLDADWCTVSPMGGDASPEVRITVTVVPNESDQTRKCSAVLKCGDVYRYIAITQQTMSEPTPDPGPDPGPDPDPDNPFLTPDTVLIDVDEEEAEQTVSVSSNDSWTVSSDGTWCSVTPSQGSGNGAVTLYIQANTESASRRCNVTFHTSRGAEAVLVVRQSRGYKTLDWDSAFYHRSLFTRFTATWCVHCPTMLNSFLAAQELYPSKLVQVAIHDESSDLGFADSHFLENQYYVYGFPTGVVDGRIEIRNEGVDVTAPKIVAAARETEELFGTKTGIEINSTVSGRDVSIDLTVYAKEAGSYKLTVLLLEDGIVNAQVGAKDGYMIHDDVARISVTSTMGDHFSIPKARSGSSFQFSVKNISSSYDITMMKILAYVQSDFGYTHAEQSADYGDYYVDNCVTVPLGRMLNVQMEGDVSSGQNEGITPGEDIDM